MTSIRDGQPVGIIDQSGAIIATGTIHFGKFWATNDEHSYEYVITDESSDGITPDQFDKPRDVATVADLRVSDIGKTVRVEHEGTDLVGQLLDFRTDSVIDGIKTYNGDLVSQIITTTVKIQLPIATITVPSNATLEIKDQS
jgi:hypothetical protein